MNHALLIHGGALGDFIMSLRVVSALRASGAGHVAVLGRPAACSVACPRGGVDEVRDLETGGYHALFAEESALPDGATEWLSQFKIAVNMLGDSKGAVARNLKRVGVGRVIDLDPRPRADIACHITEQWLADLHTDGGLGIDSPKIVIEPELAVSASARLGALGVQAERSLFIAPGSGSPKKCWPLPEFLRIADRAEATGRTPVFVLGPVEVEQMVAGDLAELRRRRRTLEGLTTLELAACLAVGGGYLGNDSGVSHLAAAVGARVVGVFGATDPAVWRPLGPNVRVVGGIRNGGWPTHETVWDGLMLAFRG